MIDYLPKSGLLQKGQTLSLSFFEHQIASNLSSISRRIRDIIEIQGKRKGLKQEILSEQQYTKHLFARYSLNYASGFKQRQSEKDENWLPIIDDQLVSDYPIFYEPKWKIFIQGDEQPTIKQLAMINHLAYGYFYETNQEGDVVCLLKLNQEADCYLLREELYVQFGTVKILDNRKGEFCYTDYISYNSSNQEQRQRKYHDPRKNFDIKEALKDQKYEKHKFKKTKTLYMTKDKLKQRLEASTDPYQCLKYEQWKPNDRQIKQFNFKMKCLEWLENTKDVEEIEKQRFLVHQQKKLHDEKEDSSIIKENIGNFSSSAKLVNELQKIPNFSYHLSDQQREVIAYKGNIIVIGRSGTGKTTCALLRLFTLETFFKIRQVGSKNIKSKHMDENSKMRNIFLTASSFLIEELKRNYMEHVSNVKFQLEKIQAKRNGVEEIQRIQVQVDRKQENISDFRMLDNKANKMSSLCNLTPADYPGFFTLKNFLIMIDGIFNKGFFFRQNENNLNNQNEINFEFNKKTKYWIKGQDNKIYQSQQINYEYFRDIFWVTEKVRRKQFKFALSPITVWQQIYSIIKGSTEAHRCPNFYISEEMYLDLSKNKSLKQEQKRQLYAIFLLYDKWKNLLHKFDLMDIVNYLLNKIRRNTYLGPTINHLFIDEVQDMTPATIFLVSQITENNLFYGGDTAQSISKGVVFKFSDIKALFKPESSVRLHSKEEPDIMQLTVNFRSHSSILRVANFLVKIIELLYPKSVDSLKKQTSNDKGPQPVIVHNVKQIKQILFQKKENSSDKLSSKQAIIVRNEKSKAEAKKQFQNAIILTIEQCKGLQFDDVVIWGFMENSKLEQAWRILQLIQINKSNVNKRALHYIISQKGSILDTVDDYMTVSKKIHELNFSLYQQINSELKLLYTAITRAKQILVLFNSLPNKLHQLLMELQLICEISQDYLDTVEKRRFEIQHKEKKQSNESQQKQQIQDWKRMGIKFYTRENYEQALVCFQNVGDTKLCKQIKGKMKVKQGQKIIQIIKTEQLLSKHENKEHMQQINELERQMKFIFQEAAVIFQEIKSYQNAGKAYFFCKKYAKAISCFSKMNMFPQMAQCYIELNNYPKAAQIFERAGRYQKAIELLVKSKMVITAFIKLSEYSDKVEDFKMKRVQLKVQIIEEIQKQILSILNKSGQQKQKNLYRVHQFYLKSFEEKQNSEAFYQSTNSQKIQTQQFNNIITTEQPKYRKMKQTQKENKVQYKQKTKPHKTKKKNQNKKNKKKQKKQAQKQKQQRNQERKNEASQQQQQQNQGEQEVENQDQMKQQQLNIQVVSNLPNKNIEIILLENQDKVDDISLQKLKIVLFMDKQKNNIGFEQFIKMPTNVFSMIRQLEKYQRYDLCYIMCSIYKRFENFEDYFVAALWNQFSNKASFNQFNEKQMSQDARCNRFDIVSKSTKLINKLNFHSLAHIQNKPGYNIIAGLVKNLIFCGFHQICCIFMKNKIKFSSVFMWDDKFILELNKILVRNYIIKQDFIQVEYLREQGWSTNLNYEQQIYTMQILFQKYLIKTINTFMKGNSKQIKIDYRDYEQIMTIIKQKTHKLNIDKKKIKQDLDEMIHKLNYSIDQKKRVSNQLKKNEGYIKEEEFAKQRAEANLKQVLNQLDYMKSKQKNNINDQNIKFKIDKLKKEANNEKYIIEKCQQKLKQIDDDIYFDKKDLHHFDNEVKRIQKKIEKQQWNIKNLQQKINKYQFNRIYYNQIQQKKLSIKIVEHTKMYFSQLSINESSKFLSKFYNFQQISYEVLLSMLKFQVDELTDMQICEICTLAISLLVRQSKGHSNMLKILDVVSGVKNTHYLIRNKNKQQNLVRLSDNQQGNDYFQDLNYNEQKDVSFCKQRIEDFYKRILIILSNPQKNNRFYRILIGFFSCRSFNLEDKSYQFLSDFAIIKTSTCLSLNLLQDQNLKQFEFFDQTSQLMIFRREILSQMLIKYIHRSYSQVFAYKLSQEQVQFKKKVVQQSKQNESFSYSEAIVQQQRYLNKKFNQVEQNLRKLKIDIFFNNTIGEKTKASVMLKNLSQIKKNQRLKSNLQSRMQKLQTKKQYQREKKDAEQLDTELLYEKTKKQLAQIQVNKMNMQLSVEQRDKQIMKQTAIKQKLEKLKNKLDEQRICCICYETNVNITTQCRHTYHLECLFKNIIVYFRRDCAYCRADLYEHDTSIGICQQCNKNQVQFNLKKLITRKQSLFCAQCVEVARAKKRKLLLFQF